MNRYFLLFFFAGLSALSMERKLIIDNTADRGIFIAQSFETEDEIITEGYWNVLPHKKGEFELSQQGKLSVRINFSGDTSHTATSGMKRCGNETERFKTIEKKHGEPKITLFTGEGTLENGYATKKDGTDCVQLGGVLLDGFEDAVPCSSSNPAEMCLPKPLTDERPTPQTSVGVCNETDIPALYVAIRFFENNEFRTQGWWKVQSHKCLELGPFPSEKGIFGLATSSSGDPDASEWTPSWSNELACINPETAFDYAEAPNGKCEARESIPANAPPPVRIMMGKLAGDGYRGLVTFDLKPTFISLYRSKSTGEIAMAKDPNATAAKLAAKVSCGKMDCEELTQVQNQCLSFAVGDDMISDYGWGRNANRVKAEELALQYCREGSEDPTQCRVLITECP